jgi:hypothetical protein
MSYGKRRPEHGRRFLFAVEGVQLLAAGATTAGAEWLDYVLTPKS